MTTDRADPMPAPRWTKHGRKQWRNRRRNDVPDRDLDQAWAESIPVDYPSARDGARGRYHADGDCVLLVKDDDDPRGRLRPHVVTVLNLDDRDRWEQYYVRCQAWYNSGGGRR